MKFSLPEKNIWIITKELKSRVKVAVRDQGPDLTDNDKKLMFRPFQKLSARATSGESSNGLGLSIIKTLATKLKAEIIVESELGVGTEFSLIVPKMK